MRAVLVALFFLAACRRSPSAPEAAAEVPTRSVTIWTNQTELFLEHPALVAGEAARFAVHLTVLGPSWKPLEKGQVTVALDMGGARQEAKADPVRPGLFVAAVTPAKGGPCTLRVLVRGPTSEEAIDAGACQVHATRAQAVVAETDAGRGQGADGRFSFRKEQQWQGDFATAAAAERELTPTVRLHGEIKPVAGKEARISAAASGRVQLTDNAPILGMQVRKGQLLGSLLPRLGGGADRASLEAEARAVRVELTAAEAQRARAERLLAEEAVPQKSVEEARAAVETLRARLTAAESRLAQHGASTRGMGAAAGPGAFQIRAPLDGILVAATVASGESVEEGAPLFVVMDLRHVWLEARVFEPDIAKVERGLAEGKKLRGWFSLDGAEAPLPFDADNARLITLGRVVDPHTRTVPLIFELDNRAGKLRVGQYADVEVASGEPVRLIALPTAAVIEEAGRALTYVQVEGESFERRPLVVQLRTGEWVGVREGLRVGERVVTKGAYDLRLASAGGAIPGHGHAH